MKYCTKCGSESHHEAVVCIHCGCSCEPKLNQPDISSSPLNFLAFLFPLIGFIMYLCMKSTTPPLHLDQKEFYSFALQVFSYTSFSAYSQVFSSHFHNIILGKVRKSLGQMTEAFIVVSYFSFL